MREVWRPCPEPFATMKWRSECPGSRFPCYSPRESSNRWRIASSGPICAVVPSGARCAWTLDFVAATAVLMDAHRREPWVPVDPELFVMCQVLGSDASDPWSELTVASSRRRYVARVRRIIRGLRGELHKELRRIESALRRGEALEVILLGPSRRLAPAWAGLSRLAVMTPRSRRPLP